MAKTLAQFDKLKIQMEDGTAENQPTHDEESSDSKEINDSTTATSKEADGGWHEEFYSFKQETQEKFEEQAKAIHGLEQLLQDSDKNQQHQTNELASKTLEVLKKFTETQAKMNRSVEQLRTEQERHGKILPAIKSQLEKILQGSQVSQETQAHLVRLEPIQIDMIMHTDTTERKAAK